MEFLSLLPLVSFRDADECTDGGRRAKGRAKSYPTTGYNPASGSLETEVVPSEVQDRETEEDLRQFDGDMEFLTLAPLVSFRDATECTDGGRRVKGG